MSDEGGLLAAIRDEPDDDLPRLAHADWLEERGDLARARFVRVQLERARLHEYDDRQAALLAEERRLLVAHGRGWLPPEVSIYDVRFRRGYAEELDSDVPSLRKDLPAIETLPIRRLTLHPRNDGGEAVSWLRDCRWLSRIESLTLSGGYHGDRAWATAALDSPHLSRLRELDIVEENAGDVTAVLARSGHADQLEALALYTVSGGGWQEMLSLPWPRLARLRLIQGYERPEMRLLVESGLWERLDEIDLSHIEFSAGDREALTDAIGRMTARRLTLYTGSRGCDLIGPLADAPDWGKLRDLRISGLHGTYRSLRRTLNHPGAARLHRLHLPQEMEVTLAGTCPSLPDLRWLECRAADLMDFLRSADEPPSLVGLDCNDRSASASLGWFLSSPYAARLRRLKSASYLSAASAEALATSPHLRQLASLEFPARETSPDQVRAIVEAPGLPCLTYVEAEGASEAVTRELTRAPGIAWGGHASECKGELAELRKNRWGEMDWRWQWCLREE